MSDNSPIILAYSGGLDTSFCVPWLKETYNRPVVTMCINTGGLDDAAAQSLHDRAMALGAQEHVLIEARQIFFDRVLKYLIAGNVRRGNLYPLCVGAERGIQATLLAEVASERGSTTVAHGCTAAGNDQVVALVHGRTQGERQFITICIRGCDAGGICRAVCRIGISRRVRIAKLVLTWAFLVTLAPDGCPTGFLSPSRLFSPSRAICYFARKEKSFPTKVF